MNVDPKKLYNELEKTNNIVQRIIKKSEEKLKEERIKKLNKISEE